jgi:dCTP deaminase
MILSDEGIKSAIQTNQIEIFPVPTDKQYTTSAVDIFLGDKFRIWDPARFEVPGLDLTLDLSLQNFQATANQYTIEAPRHPDGSVRLPPFSRRPQVLLCLTRERVCLNKNSLLAARVEGRSSLARIGLAVHLTAPTIHAGFKGQITLEIVNHGPFEIKLIPNQTPICQLIFERLETPATCDLNTGFQNQTTPIGNIPPRP